MTDVSQECLENDVPSRPDELIIIAYDEDERAGGLAQKNGFGKGGPVVCAILSGLAVPGDSSGVVYHYSLLAPLEDGFGLPDYAGCASDVTPVRGIRR